MSCPTCDHTMKNLGMDNNEGRIFWCTRCGTMKIRQNPRSVNMEERYDVEAPKLVALAIDLALKVFDDLPTVSVQQACINIEEATVLPDNRKLGE